VLVDCAEGAVIGLDELERDESVRVDAMEPKEDAEMEEGGGCAEDSTTTEDVEEDVC
jgi:hypothetical protein